MTSVSKDDNSSSIVKDLCSSLHKHVDTEELKKKLSDRERIRYFLENGEAQKIIKSWLALQTNQEKNQTGKNKEKALKFKDAGNSAFGKSQYQSALQFYNQCITWMPHDGTKDISIAYANRSACLFYMNEISLAQQDMKLALSLNYPKELHYKLYERYGKCFLAQGKTNEATKRFKLALTALDHASIEQSKILKIRKTLEQLIKQHSSSNFSTGNSDLSDGQMKDEEELIIPELTGGESLVLRHASSRLTLRQSPNQGRFITANQDIQPGDVLVVQKAFVSTLLPEWYHTQCYQCYKSISAPIACKTCISVSYCSVECREKAWSSHHQFECQILGILKHSGISVTCYMALRLVTQTGLKTLRKWAELAEKTEEKSSDGDEQVEEEPIPKVDQKERTTNEEEKENQKDGKDNGKLKKNKSTATALSLSSSTSPVEFDPNEEYRADENSLFHLVTHSRQRGSEDIFQRTVMASFLLALLLHTKTPTTKRSFFDTNSSTSKQEHREKPAGTAVGNETDAATGSGYGSGSENNDDSLGRKEDGDQGDQEEKEKKKAIKEDKGTNSSSSSSSPPCTVNEDELTVGTILLRSLQFLQFNAHEVAGWDSGEEKSVFLSGGLYLTLALFNHSCNPAIVRYFINDTVVVRAIRTIYRGEEVTENYGPIFTSTTRDQRRATLRSQYWFDCSCSCCREDWPLFDNLSQNSMSFRCSFCHSFLGKNDDASLGLLLQCRRCSRPTNILKCLKDLQASEGKYNDAMGFLRMGRDATALGILLQNIQLLDSILLPPYKEYHMVQEEARKCYLALGNKCEGKRKA